MDGELLRVSDIMLFNASEKGTKRFFDIYDVILTRHGTIDGIILSGRGVLASPSTDHFILFNELIRFASSWYGGWMLPPYETINALLMPYSAAYSSGDMLDDTPTHLLCEPSR